MWDYARFAVIGKVIAIKDILIGEKNVKKLNDHSFGKIRYEHITHRKNINSL